MTTHTRNDDNHSFKLACLASIAAGAVFFAMALASAATIVAAVSVGISIALIGMFVSALIKCCCMASGGGAACAGNPRPGVVYVDNSLRSHPTATRQSPGFFSRLGNWNTNEYGNSVRFGHQTNHGHNVREPAAIREPAHQVAHGHGYSAPPVEHRTPSFSAHRHGH